MSDQKRVHWYYFLAQKRQRLHIFIGKGGLRYEVYIIYTYSLRPYKPATLRFLLCFVGRFSKNTKIFSAMA